MSLQYSDKYYCSTNQSPSHWGINLTLTADINQYNLITKDVYEQMYASLKAIHDFGDYDKVVRKPNIDNKLEFNKNTSLIPPDLYNDIAKRIETSQDASQYSTIYGTYFSDLQKKIEAYKIPSTRYYKEQYNCCDYCDDCSYCSYRAGCGSCNMCIDSFDNGCHSGQGGNCGSYANGTMDWMR